MKALSNFLLTQILWLLVSIFLIAGINAIVFDWDFIFHKFNVNLYTYTIFSSSKIIIFFILFVAFLTFFFQQWKQKFSRANANIIIMFTGLALIVFLVKVESGLSGGWESYPPSLSFTNEHIRSPVAAISNMITISQVIIFLCLVLVTYTWGKMKRSV